jgi:adsorption protein B
MGWTMEGGSPGLGRMALAAGVLSGVNLAARAWCSGRIYGWAFGLLAPLRLLWANGINSAAVFVAARGVLSALWSGKGLAWRKTDHVYPWMGSGGEVRALGEILVNRRVLTSQELHRARVECPPGMKLAEFLLETGRVSAADIQRARNLQYGFAEPGPATIAPARLLPAPVAEHWRVVPVGIGPGEIYLASIDLPRPGLERELRRHTHRRPRLLLVTPARFGQLRAEFEGVEGCRTKAPTKKQKNHLHHLGVFAILTKRLWATQTFETSSSRESKEVKISGCKASEDLIG